MSQIYEFGPFRLDASAGKLTRADHELHLAGKAYATLLFLVQRAGALVSKDELLGQIWPEGFVEPANLTQTIYVLRKTLDDADAQLIETVPGRGYRFAARVRVSTDASPSLVSGSTSRLAGPLAKAAWSLAAAVLASLTLVLHSSASSGGQTSLVSPEARLDYTLGRYYWNQRTYAGVVRGVDYFKAALLVSPTYAQGFSGIADSYSILGYYSKVSTPQRTHLLTLARAAALRAISLDPNLAEAHASLAFADDQIGAYEIEEVREFQRSIALDPSYATAHEWYSWFLFHHRSQHEALTQMEQARDLDPLSPIINFALANQLFFSRRYEEASEQWHQAIAIDPDSEIGYYGAGLADEQLDNYQLAAQEFRHALTLSPTDADTIGALAYALARMQQPDGARSLLAKITHMKPVPAYDIALITDALGHHAQALHWLAIAQARHDRNFMSYPFDPRMDDLRRAAAFSHKDPSSNV